MEDNERLQSLDEYGGRVKIIPADVRGYWRDKRTQVQLVLLFIFMVLPWVYVNGNQALLLNIAKREFAIFGITFFAHDAPLIFFILALLTVGLAFITAVWGRIWCGWGCPQTVFIDGVYRRIEKWIEGSALEQMKLHREEMSLRKLRLKITKWLAFTFVSAVIAHSFLAYFVGSRELLAMMQKPPQDNWTYFVLVFVMTGFVLFDFAWFREQFCIIMCPYGRFQSVLMDDRSQTIFYDAQRGEPRKGRALDVSQKTGDCVSCNRCVQVCPTKIDIRNGLQMECIACTACIDACDEIMEKVKKPKGLIRYASLKGQSVSWKQPRNLVYLAVMIAVTVGLIYNIAQRQGLSYSLLRGIEGAFTLTQDGEGHQTVTNHFRLHLKNQSSLEKKYQIELLDFPQGQLITPQRPILLKSFENKTIHFFVNALSEQIGTQKSVVVQLKNEELQNEVYLIPVSLVGPGDVKNGQ